MRDQNLLYSFSQRERPKPPSRSLFLCFVSSLFFFLSDFVRRLLLYTRGLFYAESFSFTTLMRFLFSSVCSELSKKRLPQTKTLNKKVSSSSLRLERNLSYRSFFLIFLKYTTSNKREISREMFNTFYKTFMVRFIIREEGQRRARTLFCVFSFRRMMFFFPDFPSFSTSSSSSVFINFLFFLSLSSKKIKSNTSVYVGVIIAGALVGEKMVNKGFDSMWESRNKGKLFKDLKLPEAEEE